MTLRWVLAVLPGLFLSPAASAADPRPYLAPWLAVAPGDPRIARLAALPAAVLSPNAPGLLLKIDASLVGGRLARRSLARGARQPRRTRARRGLALGPCARRCPTSPSRPILGPPKARPWTICGRELARFSKGAEDADLVTIAFAAPADGDPKARAYLLRKAAAGARAAAPRARIAFAASPTHGPERHLCRDPSPSFRRKRGLSRHDRRRRSRRSAPAAIRKAIDDVAFGKPGLVDLGSSAVTSPGALLAAAARLAPENVPFVVASPAWPPAEDAALERFARIVAGDFGPDSRASAASADGRRRDRRLPPRLGNGSRRRRPPARHAGRRARARRRPRAHARRDAVRLGRDHGARDRGLEEARDPRRGDSRAPHALSREGSARRPPRRAREGARRGSPGGSRGRRAPRDHGRGDPRAAPGVAGGARRAVEDPRRAQHDVDALPLRRPRQHARPRARRPVLLREGRQLRLGRGARRTSTA